MIKVIVFGAGGQVGQALKASKWPVGWRLRFLDRRACDLNDRMAIRTIIERYRPALIVNAAAYTAVDQAESDRQAAWSINATAVQAMAEAAVAAGAALVHFSTDYVFDGRSQRPWREADTIGPLNFYGASKAAVELAIQAWLTRHLIVRTGWVYGGSGRNFVNTMLKLGQSREHLSVVDDQWGRPTLARDLAPAVIAAAQSALENDSAWGTYHLTNGGPPTTWARLAQTIFGTVQYRQRTVPTIEPVASIDYPTAARRPLNSVLDNRTAERTFGIRLRPWQDALAESLRAPQQVNAA